MRGRTWLAGAALAGMALAVTTAGGAIGASISARANGEIFIRGGARAVPSLPPGFVDTPVITGLASPTVVQFAPDGRVFVGEKSGVVLEFDSLSDPTPTTV